MHILRGMLNEFTDARFKSLETNYLWDMKISYMVQGMYMGLTLRRHLT